MYLYGMLCTLYIVNYMIFSFVQWSHTLIFPLFLLIFISLPLLFWFWKFFFCLWCQKFRNNTTKEDMKNNWIWTTHTNTQRIFYTLSIGYYNQFKQKKPIGINKIFTIFSMFAFSFPLLFHSRIVLFCLKEFSIKKNNKNKWRTMNHTQTAVYI